MSNEASKNNSQITDKQNELFDKVNEHDEIIGTVTRGEAHKNKSIIHRAVIVLLFNSKGQLLLQKRSMTKDMYAGAWATSCSGHVGAGKSYEETAKQELWEELGIKTTNPLTFLFKDILYSQQETEYIAVYKYVTDDTIKKSEEEVSEIKYFDLSDSKDIEMFEKLEKAPDLAFVRKVIVS